MAESNIQEVLAMYEQKGATTQFSPKLDGVVHCHGCGAEEPAEQTPLVAMHRFEGDSAPDTNTALAAIECAACGAWGTMLFAYGPETSAEDASVLAALLDDRDQSGIEPGS